MTPINFPRFSWVPEIETMIIDDKNAAPQGGGEPAIITMRAMLANVLYDAIGIRMFQLPMRPERIKKHLRTGEAFGHETRKVIRVSMNDYRIMFFKISAEFFTTATFSRFTKDRTCASLSIEETQSETTTG